MADQQGRGTGQDGSGPVHGGKRRKNLIYYTMISQTRGAPYGSFGVLCPRSWYIYIGRKTLHLHVN